MSSRKDTACLTPSFGGRAWFKFSFRETAGAKEAKGSTNRRKEGVNMSHENYRSCIEACQACAVECEHCAAACLSEPDVKMMARCIQLDQQCAKICNLASGYMAGGSEFAEEACGLCADVCWACAEECRKHKTDHCQRCADACERCAEECERMASVEA